jgi:hypothetical protein
VQPDSNARKASVPPQAEEDVLDEVESLLFRMLIGVIKFPFIRLPRLLYRTLRFLFPAAVRVIRIGFLVSILCVVVCGPAAFAYFFDTASNWLADRIPTPLLTWMKAHSAITRASCYAWMVVAMIGSMWGAIYARQKRKRKLVPRT